MHGVGSRRSVVPLLRPASHRQSQKLIRAVSRRLTRYVRTRPAVFRRVLNQALDLQQGITRGGRTAVGDPLWLLAPAWLLAERRDRSCLADILFAQCCLFLAIRLHDDLVDRQVQGAWLIFVGDDLFVEAQSQFARHIDEQAFWSQFRRATTRTLHAIAEVDRLQTQPSGMPASARLLYGNVSAILSVGVAAAFARRKRLADYAGFERLFDDLAIASQLLDDLEDIEEDAARGRLNVAATLIIGSRAAAARSRGTRFRRKILTQRMVLDGRAEVVIRLARQHVKRAERRATAMGLRPAVEYASQMREYCEAVGDASHRARVDLLFAPLRLVSGRQRSAN